MHNIKLDKFGKGSFYSAREKAWHGLGTVTEEAVSSSEAIKLAKLNYIVGKKPVRYYDYEGIDREFKGKFVTYNTENSEPFGVVGSKYEVVQNEEAFKFFDSIVGKGEAIYETAGALGNGETIFVTAKLPSHISVGGEDNIDKYLLLTMSHDGSSAIKAGFTPIRVVCNNTLHWALRGGLGNQMSIRHTKDARRQLEEAHKIMGITNKLSDQLEIIFNKMADQSILDDDAHSLITRIMLDEETNNTLWTEYDGDYREMYRKKDLSGNMFNKLNDINHYYKFGVGQESILGTKYGIYNAITGYYQNVFSNSNVKKGLESNVFGHNANVMKRAFTLINGYTTN